MIKELDITNFDNELKKGLKLVEFYAPWCGFCNRQEPILEELDKIWIGKVDTDDNRNIAQKFSISSLPTFILFKEGKEVDRFLGLHSKFDLMDRLNKHITN